MRHILVFLVVFALAGFQAARADERPKDDLQKLARDAVRAKNDLAASLAIQRLRNVGPEGLNALFEVYSPEIKLMNQVSAFGRPNQSELDKIAAAIDTVGGQRDCYASRLYWYTDLADARTAAEREKKPILSLRLLGNLTDELSCANSRFFRSTLYANQEISQLLRERFILHWKSVRPVPKVTIDFGDGRKIETTVTGNSIHYVLDYEGSLVDALPGLYGPQAFLRSLESAEQLCKDLSGLRYSAWKQAFCNYHLQRARNIRAAWRDDLRQAGIELPEHGEASANSIGKDWCASERAVTTDEVWPRLGSLHGADAQLDQASVAMIGAQQVNVQNALRAGRVALFGKGAGENPLLKLLANFQSSLAAETVRNEYLLHGQIHCWLAELGPVRLTDFNERVYSELFLTPSSDPWLGLIPADTYVGLKKAGIIEAVAK